MERHFSEVELLDRQARRESNARSYPRGMPVAVARAQGCELWSVEGRRYLDFFAGAGVLALGHNHPEVVAAAKRQMDSLVHALDLASPARDAFVTALLDVLPPALRGKMKVHVCAPTGSDAVEAAIKLCKRATDRDGVVAFQGSYHGMTAGALAVTSLVEVKERVRSLMPGVAFAPYAYCARCPLKLGVEQCNTACAAMFESMLSDTHSGVPTPAAAIVEFVQGEGGSIVPTRDFAARIRRAATDAAVPLVADEVQAGLGRTGRWWSFEHFDVMPDVIVTSKALGGIGLPIAAILYREDLDVWEPGLHIGTFRGHQVAMAAGAAALRILQRDDVLANVNVRGGQLLTGLRKLATPAIREVRGLGLMLGVEFAHPETGEPLSEYARRVRAHCFRRGLLCELGGRADATLRLLPPLVVTEAEVEEALGILRDAVRAVERGEG